MIALRSGQPEQAFLEERVAAVAEVGRGDRGAVRAVHGQVHLLPRMDAALEASDVVRLRSVDPDALSARAVHELAGEHPHENQVRPVDPLEALRDHRAHAEQHRALGGPVAR